MTCSFLSSLIVFAEASRGTSTCLSIATGHLSSIPRNDQFLKQYLQYICQPTNLFRMPASKPAFPRGVETQRFPRGAERPTTHDES